MSSRSVISTFMRRVQLRETRKGRNMSRTKEANPLPPFGCVSPALALRDLFLALDDVVDLEHLGLARKLDSNVLQHRHEALSKCIELLSRVPDLADSEVPVRLEGDVELESLRQPVARLLQPADGLVVLLGRHVGRGREAGKDPCLAGVQGRGRSIGGHSWPPLDGLPLAKPTYNRTPQDALAWRARILSQKALPNVSRSSRGFELSP